jgi:adenylate kinase family enzyme
MTPEDIKAAIKSLPKEQRHEIAIYLTHLELVDDANYFETLRERMNDQLADAWKDLDDLD